MRLSGPTLGHTYVVGLLATLVLGSLTAAGLFAAQASQAHGQMRQQRALQSVETLPVPPSLTNRTVLECGEVNIDRCLHSLRPPAQTLKDVQELMSRVGQVHASECATGVRPEAARCSVEADLDGVPVRVLLWPHITQALRFEGTDVWLDVRTDTDV